jgi:hypothetical protein
VAEAEARTGRINSVRKKLKMSLEIGEGGAETLAGIGRKNALGDTGARGAVSGWRSGLTALHEMKSETVAA